MPDKSKKDVPTTAGELRRLIAEKGLNWTVDPRLRDEDLLRAYPRGGQEPRDAKEQPEKVRDVSRLLRGHPPVNPFLRARWNDLKLLSEAEGGVRAGTPPTPSVQKKEEK